jgi:hypothetical protein
MEMKRVINYTLACGVAFFIGVFTAFYYVDTTIYDESVNTAHDIDTWQDIEMIIFGEIQE